jgi:hypothetical protein
VFPPGLCSTVHQRKCSPGTTDTAGTSVSLGQGDHICTRHTRRRSQSIQVRHRDIARQMAGDIQRRAGRSRDGQFADDGDFVGIDAFLPDDDASAVEGVLAIISMGVDASTQRAPRSAAAARPAITPLRPVHSHAATVFR